ncbi:MAG: diacylglycerol kinase family protein [Coriobacteriia bacterium]|nr:diacylglycerol kinase family protein [Coriobacteriia bacterium]
MNILMVANMHSGWGDPGLYSFVRDLGEAGTEVTLRFLNEDADTAQLVRDADHYDRVVAVGGDGTVSSIAYALRGTGIPIVAYPAGTANLLARNLKLPLEAHELATLTLEGTVVHIDLGELITAEGTAEEQRSGFVIMAGAGFDANVMEGARELKSVIGEGAYIISAIQNLQPTVADLELELDGEKIKTQGIAVLFVNLARIQFDLSVTHSSDATDGLLEVVIVKTKSIAGLIPAVWAALLDRMGHHPARPALEIHTARHIRVLADPALPLQADGDALSRLTPVVARVLPGAATFVVESKALSELDPSTST